MKNVSSDALKQAVEAQYVCSATLAQSVYVKEVFEGETLFEGVVHVFDLEGCLKARRAYSWADRIESGAALLSAVLHFGPITCAREAVQAAVLAGADGRLTFSPELEPRIAMRQPA